MSSMEKAREHFDQIPDFYLEAVVHYINDVKRGQHASNDTTLFDFTQPHLKPLVKNTYPIFILQYGLLAVFAVLSNIAVLAYIVRLRLFYDSTHAFIVNLAVCHIVQCVITLPITLMVTIIQNWIFGNFLCFFLPFLQDIPLHVLITTHVLIAWDRMRWLSDPLKGRIPAFVCSCATWLAGMVIALPYPIYTAYVDLGQYVKDFMGVGVCIYNLMDDMQEYIRGLFVIMYCLPSILLAYLYIRTSRDLKAPEGPLGVMMFEVRSSIRHKRSASTTLARTNRNELSKAYDLFDAELDVSKDKRAQKHLGAMACTQVICTCPLMILRLAKMVLTETYENTSHFDLTYLMFVWIAFLPAAINPWIYGSLVLPSPIRDRFYSYFRFSRHGKQETPDQRSSFDEESSTMLENGGLMLNPTRISNNAMEVSSTSKYKQINSAHAIGKKSSVKRPLENKQHSKVRTINDGKSTKTSRLSENDNYLDTPLSLDTINNSCSNITASTYCINSGERESLHFETSPYAEKHATLTVSNNNNECSSQRSSFKRKQLPQVPPLPLQHLLDKRPSYASTDVSSIRRDSSSTLERDLEIIDILERERSMDLQEINQFPESSVQHMRKSSRKMPRSPKKMMSEETDGGYAGDRSTCSGYTVNSGSNVRRTISERVPQYDRLVPSIRRTSHDMDAILSVVDRKISRTKSNEPQIHTNGSVRQQVQAQYRRHSSEKYPFYNNYSNY